MHPNQRIAANFATYRFAELAIDLHVGRPSLLVVVKDRLKIVEQGPERTVAKAVVIPFNVAVLEKDGNATVLLPQQLGHAVLRCRVVKLAPGPSNPHAVVCVMGVGQRRGQTPSAAFDDEFARLAMADGNRQTVGNNTQFRRLSITSALGHDMVLL